MNAKSEQFGELQRKNMEAGMRLAQLSLNNSQRIIALQVETAKQLFQDSIENARALASVRDPNQVFALQSRYAQETARKMMEVAQEIADITNTSRAELNHLLTEQFSHGNKDIMSTFKSMMSNVPGPNTDIVANMKQAMNKATDALEQLTKTAAPAKSSSTSSTGSAPKTARKPAAKTAGKATTSRKK